MPDSEAGCPHPFGDNAVRLHKLGLVVFPCGGDDGKRPLVNGWQRPEPAKPVATWAQRFAADNIGVACGLSGYVVVDVDKPELVETMLERFGDTPLITRTPGGGAHLWYRKVGVVRSGDLRKQGLDVDIKADGGSVVVPPSRGPKRAYAFERGSWDDLQRLPPLRQEVLAAPPSNDNDGSAAAAITEGDRNNALFATSLRIAPRVESFDALLAEASRFNNEVLRPPLSPAEVEKTARSAWRYQTEGRNRVGRQGHVDWAVELVQMCAPHKHGGDAVILMTVLRAQHAKREGPFAVAPRAMAANHVIPGWSEHRTRQALRAALRLGLIKPVYKGGRGLRDPSLYELPS